MDRNLSDQLAAVLNLLLSEREEAMRKKTAEAERLARAAAIEGARQEEIRLFEQQRCSHRNERGEPRTGGQRLPDGRVLIICLFCQKKWYLPAQKGEEAPPRELMPPGEFIGG